MTVGASTATVANDFVITPSAITSSTSVAFTNDDGDTFVSVSNGTGYDTLPADTAASKIIAYTVKATISYSGDLSTQASVQALWQSKITNVVLDMSCTAVDNTSANHIPLSGTGAAGDVKFTSADDNYEHAAANMKVSKAATNFTFGTPTDANEDGTYEAVTSEVTVGIIYVGLAGRDNLVVDATHMPVYTLTLGASQSA